MPARAGVALAALATTFPALAQELVPQAAGTAVVRGLSGIDTVGLRDGRELRLAGIGLPAPSVRRPGAAAALRRRLADALVGREVTVEVLGAGDDGFPQALLRPHPDAPSINEEMLAGGHAVLDLPAPGHGAEVLLAAARRAQEAGAGHFARSPARRWHEVDYVNGAVLGMHAIDPDFRYDQHLDELAAAGFEHLCLLFPAFVADVRGSRIDRHHPRTPTDARLLDTIALARERGMTVLLLPIVLLEAAGPREWRGRLAPDDPVAFWRSYDRFLCWVLDLAEHGGADAVSVGSELGSLERQTEQWRRLIRMARGRFGGMLTYSANWDHVHVPRFFDQLDFVGMTAYFELTDAPTTDVRRLQMAWRRIGLQLRQTLGGLGRPLVITELGYPSRRGANTDPWNHVAGGEVCLAEQAACLQAFLAVAGELELLDGAYLYDYFDAGGAADRGYSPRGKPAMESWRRWARRGDPRGR